MKMSWLRRRWAALRHRGTDRGASITTFVLVMALGIVAVIGLTWVAGTHIRGVSRAERVATEAARAGLQAYRTTGQEDPVAAVAAAERYLSTADFDGTLSGRAHMVGPGELRVDVDVQTPGALGIDTLIASGSGYADLINSVVGD